MLFFRRKSASTYSLIYEIGSGSVMMSIIESSRPTTPPIVVWSHREHIAHDASSDINRIIKRIATATLNVGMLFTSEGLQALAKHNPRAKIKHSFATLTAPWSYTINKTVSYSNDTNTDFIIDEGIIQDLVDTAVTNTKTELDKHESFAETLAIINHQTIALEANGYKISNPIGKKTRHIAMSHITALAQTNITEIITDVHNKALPNVSVELYSFMMIFFSLSHTIVSHQDDYCLFDITHEAGELGIVRDRKLSYCSHFKGGINSLTNALCQATGLPYESMTAYLKATDPAERTRHIPAAKQPLVATVLAQYQADLLDLFSETDGLLATPRIIYLHCQAQYETFFIEQLQAALCSAVQPSTCAVKSLAVQANKKLQIQSVTDSNVQTDSRLKMSASFFHTKVSSNQD